MAILYGTQSNGETLPVLVDQFGNLIAKGIEGQPGPPGPPGIGELPPDPIEGAILGWQDGELAWIGGSVPLPAGTYGPYVYTAEGGTLDVPQDASGLINGQQLYMSDQTGANVTADCTTDTIASVESVGEWNTSADWTSNTTPAGTGLNSLNRLYDTNFYNFTVGDNNNFALFINGLPATTTVNGIKVRMMVDDGCQVTFLFQNGSFVIPNMSGGRDDNPLEWTVECPIGTVLTGIQCYKSGRTGSARVYEIKINDKPLVDSRYASSNPPTGAFNLTFPTNKDFDKFEVGDVVQDPDVKITDIEAGGPTITVDGGAWKGADGSGSGVQTELTTTASGSGSVSMGLNGRIVLRNNNGEWVDGFYVTAPEQRIAARKVVTSAMRKKTK